jgi:hypothetical protein
MSYGKILIFVAITFTVLGCTTEGTSNLEGKYGHWIYRGSSTFNQIFQCVDKFEPHQNKECK